MLDLLPISWKSRWAGSVHSFFLRWRAFRLSSTVIGVAADLGSSRVTPFPSASAENAAGSCLQRSSVRTMLPPTQAKLE